MISVSFRLKYTKLKGNWQQGRGTEEPFHCRQLMFVNLYSESWGPLLENV